MTIRGQAKVEQWPLKEAFTISRSSRTHVDVVYLEIEDGAYRGRGECQPNTRYGEDPEGVAGELNAFLKSGIDQAASLKGLKSASARNALDCALWDLRAKQQTRRVWQMLGQPEPAAISTVFTLSWAEADSMAEAAKRAWTEGKTILKLKLGGQGDDERVRAVRTAVPDARLIADANEGWSPDMLMAYLPVLADAGLELLEQPLPAGQDNILAEIDRLVPICADESCHSEGDVPKLRGKYDAANIKLDKTGGLTAALALADTALLAGLDLMVGCMLGTSLAMAPAMFVATQAKYVDLDGPLLLMKDRDHKMFKTDDFRIYPPSEKLWG